MQRYDTEFVRRDGTRFPAEATVSKIEIKGEPFISGFIRDVSERERRQQERETLLREQAARAEAERVAELVSGMQLLVDAALAAQHARRDPRGPDHARSRGAAGGRRDDPACRPGRAPVGGRLVGAGRHGGRRRSGRPEPIALGEGFAGRVAQAREAMLAHAPAPADLPDPALGRLEVDSLIGVPLLAENKVIGVLVAASVAPRRFSSEDLARAPAGRRPRRACDPARARVRARAPHRGDAPAQPAAPEDDIPQPRVSRGCALRARSDRGGRRRRLVRRDPDADRRARAGDGRRGRQGARRGVDGRPAAQRAARLRARGPRARRA